MNRDILLLDDDLDEHLLIEGAFSDKPDLLFTFHFYTSAKLALQHLEDGFLMPSIIVLDINMPVMNGIQFLTELRQRRILPDIPVIMHTTGYSDHTRQACEALGATAYIKKGLNYDALFDTINTILDGKLP